jgi:hypothetical protein
MVCIGCGSAAVSERSGCTAQDYYRAIDRTGALVGVMFSEHRDMAAAMAFSESTRYLPASRPTGSPRMFTTVTHWRSGRPWARMFGTATALSQQPAGARSSRCQGPPWPDAGVQMPAIGWPILPGLRRVA